tara:strand:+ start:272 stop:640 length:369 start_codon:yes stop_codon:yes gene_type:complete
MSWMSNTRSACNGNTNGYIYALVRMNKRQMPDGSADLLTRSEDPKFYLNNEFVKYIGCTNNPISRLQSHRHKKGKKIGMVIFGEAETPAEGKMMEAEAIYNYCKIKGEGPAYQKGHDTWAGA